MYKRRANMHVSKDILSQTLLHAGKYHLQYGVAMQKSSKDKKLNCLCKCIYKNTSASSIYSA